MKKWRSGTPLETIWHSDGKLMRKGEALRGKREVFAWCQLQFKRFIWSRSLNENGVSKRVPNRPTSNPWALLGQIFEILGCFRKRWNFDEVWSQQTSTKNLKNLDIWRQRVVSSTFLREAWRNVRRELILHKLRLLFGTPVPRKRGRGI